MQFSPILLILAAAAAVVASPAPHGELAERAPEAFADPQQGLTPPDWKRD
ncbi:hypothetical protein EV363DRAFT_1449074 [Boletus edulis]|uniref:Uncharacterized protein n=1 Tax=Boletus edulis BED1 TaxID=1328754 RepID=A0AAD4B9M8_BOLED|nr:hypothetical protein EV363DRAFT_1449074 [Boletus edulis]KAF8415000.1 hypothetical protein L210DRAFT_3658108 [Boletus edulis BED1]KAF8436283.1 hypothetical protein L210DRAFT_3648039 [Boletus edulis BED1]